MATGTAKKGPPEQIFGPRVFYQKTGSRKNPGADPGSKKKQGLGNLKNPGSKKILVLIFKKPGSKKTGFNFKKSWG